MVIGRTGFAMPLTAIKWCVITLSLSSGLSDGNVNFGAANNLRKIGISDAPGRGCRLCCSFVNAHQIGLCCNGTCVRGGLFRIA